VAIMVEDNLGQVAAVLPQDDTFKRNTIMTILKVSQHSLPLQFIEGMTDTASRCKSYS